MGQAQLKVGRVGDRISPRFAWELRDKSTGQEVSTPNLLAENYEVLHTSNNCFQLNCTHAFFLKNRVRDACDCVALS